MKFVKPTPEEIREENSKLRRIRFIVDLTAAILMQGNLTLFEAITLVDNTKKFVLSQYPDKEDTYDLIYKPRFDRIIRESLERN
ncbi:hypothetical protein JXB12_00765 [candidate division KSB1 bacterium]|nr:hypothetical protein [candidate division KSB1 bacterium]